MQDDLLRMLAGHNHTRIDTALSEGEAKAKRDEMAATLKGWGLAEQYGVSAQKAEKGAWGIWIRKYH